MGVRKERERERANFVLLLLLLLLTVGQLLLLLCVFWMALYTTRDTSCQYTHKEIRQLHYLYYVH